MPLLEVLKQILVNKFYQSGRAYCWALWAEKSGVVQATITQTSAQTISGQALTPGKWEHIVFTWEAGKQVRLYQNGVLVASANSTLTRLPYSYYNLEINVGRDAQTGTDYFKGYIDELAVYKRALTDSEVRAHYAMGKPN